MQVVSDIQRPPQDLVERYRRVRLDQIVKSLPASCFLDSSIKPLALRDFRIAGPALTVACTGASATMAIIATGAAQPGDVIVMAANSDLEGHTWGSGLTLSAKNVGCEGVVVDGLVIDSDSILELQVPVFCRGSTLRSKGTEELGSVNVPVVCGGVDIRPGDLVLGSLDGVCVIPQEELESRIQEAEPESARIQANIEKLVTSKGTIFDLRGGRGMARKLGIDWPE